MQPGTDTVDSALERIRLWSTGDVAIYLGLNERYVLNHIVTQSDFPAPILIPGRGSRPIRRWTPKSVRTWAEQRRPAAQKSAGLGTGQEALQVLGFPSLRRK